MSEAFDNNLQAPRKQSDNFWRVEMFGNLRLLPPGAGPGDAITHFPARKATALLAYLAYHHNHGNGLYKRDVLADALWPDTDSEKARNNLRVTLNRLRHTLFKKGHNPDDFMVVEKNVIGLNWSRLETDVACFEQYLQAATGASTLGMRLHYLSDAVDLYRGELLRDCEETWISPEARRLEGLFFDATRDLLALLEEENKPDRALHYAYHAVNVNPLREEAHYDLLRLYIAQGQHDSARTHFDRLTKTLLKNFDASPSPATKMLMVPLLKGQTTTSSKPRSQSIAVSSEPSTTTILSPEILAPLTPRLAASAINQKVLRDRSHTLSNANGHLTTERSNPIVESKNQSRMWVGGSVTFLLLDNLHPISDITPFYGDEDAVQSRAQLREIISRYGGHEFGNLHQDGIWSIFRATTDALACALALRDLARRQPRFRTYCGECRMALDTGDGGLWAINEDESKHTARNSPDKTYIDSLEVGIKRTALNRVLSILKASHPGQTLCSEVTGVLLRRELESGILLNDLGIYRLHDAPVPERIYQVSYPSIAARDFPPITAPPLHSSELPPTLTTFFGREKELGQIVNYLAPHNNAISASTRLMTLIGFGGCGKTRLAIEAARQLSDSYQRAVWFVPLAGVREPHLIIHAIVDALRLPGSPGLDPWLQVVSELGQRPSLLVLDNFEQLHDGGTDIVKKLIALVPSLCCLITSRQSLGLEGERDLPILPLPVPSLLEGVGRPLALKEQRRRLQQINASDSVRLFIDRAQSVRPTSEVTPDYVNSVAQLCRLLDGVPLAIELVATHTQGLTPQQILSLFGRKIEDSTREVQESEDSTLSDLDTKSDYEHRTFDYLDYFHGDRSNESSRQYSLRSVIQWSYDLLAPELRPFFTRLWVFRGGWTPEAANFVAANWVMEGAPTENHHLQLVNEVEHSGENPEEPFGGVTFENLLRLQDRSLVAAEERDSEVRFSMISMLRSFAMEQLSAAQRADLEARHAAYYIGLSERASHQLMDAGRNEWLRQLDPEIDNLRAALSWSLRHAPAQCLQMAGALWRFWEARGLFAEGRDWLERALAAVSKLNQSDSKPKKENDTAAPVSASPQITPNLPLPLPLYLRALNGAGRLAWYRADFKEARRLLGECLSLVRLQDAPDATEHRRGVANALHSLGLVAMCQGDASAKAMLEEGLALVKIDGEERVIKDFMLGLALVKFYLADSGVRELLEGSLEISRRIGDQRGIAFALNNLGWVENSAQNYDAAREYHESSLPLLRDMGDKWSTARALSGLARVAWFQGDITAARAYSVENLLILRDLGSVWELVYSLEQFAWLALYDRKPQRAARLLGATDSLREATGHVLFPVARYCFEDCVARTREALAKTGDATAEALWRRGRLLSREEVITEALGK